MDVQEVRLKLAAPNAHMIRAYCSITFAGDFCVRDCKILQLPHGLTLIFPEKVLRDACPSCRHRTSINAHFCEHCGAALAEGRAEIDDDGRAKIWTNVAFPTTNACRQKIWPQVLAEYKGVCAGAPQTLP